MCRNKHYNNAEALLLELPLYSYFLKVLSDFDASLELSTEGYLLPDPPKSTSKDFYVTTDRTYHISSVGTIGFKSPEGSMYSISNSSDLMEEMTTKADIFRCKFCTIFCLL